MLAPLKQPLAVAGKRRAPTRKRRNKAVSPAVAAALSRSNEEAEAGTSTASAYVQSAVVLRDWVDRPLCFV